MLLSMASAAPFFLPDNPYQDPPAGAERCPCPFINTLANHGFINRDGKNVDIYELAKIMNEVFDMSLALMNTIADSVVARGLTTTSEPDEMGNTKELLNIAELFLHGFIEHDASYTREDDFFGDDVSQPASIEIIDALLAVADESSPIVTKADLKIHQRNRIVEGRLNNPEFNIDAQKGQLAGQTVFLLTLGSQPDLSFVTKARLNTLLKMEKLPDDYLPGLRRDPDFVAFDFSTGTVGGGVRDEFLVNVDAALEEDIDPCDDIFLVSGLLCFLKNLFMFLFSFLFD